MDFKLGRINLNAVAQGVGGLVFGNESSTFSEDSYVERLLDRISNGILSEDRRAAISELQPIVADSHAAQLAFGAMGFPVLLNILKEERDDVEMVRGSLETLVSALTPIDRVGGTKNDVQPTLMNSDMLSGEVGSISLLLSLLSEDDFYVRYYTLQILTALLKNSPNRLQEAILATPRGITRLMDMLMDREVIRNEALLLLTHLTREAEEIQKIVVFEGAFEKIFSIIKEEGGSEGGVVVQDCLELLNNLLRNNIANQNLLKETLGFEPLISILKPRQGSAYGFTQQKTINLLSTLDTVGLLIDGGADRESAKSVNRVSNQTVLAQKKTLDHLLFLGVESKWFPVAVRCSALQCIGNLVVGHLQNLNLLAGKLLGEEPNAVPALNAILNVALMSASLQEFLAAQYVLKCFCENNKGGQAMLISTWTHDLISTSHSNLEEDVKLPFGSLLLHSFVKTDSDGDLENCCRAAIVLSHILKDNVNCKEQALQVRLKSKAPSLGPPELLMHSIVKCLALETNVKTKYDDEEERIFNGSTNLRSIILRLLVMWLVDCPNAVSSFLESPSHLPYLLELLSCSSGNIYIQGLAAVLLGVCVLYNKQSSESSQGAYVVVDLISQKIGLSSFFLKFEEMQKSIVVNSVTSIQNYRPMERSNAASMKEVEDTVDHDVANKKEDNSVLVSVFDSYFVNLVRRLEADIRESIVKIFSHPKSTVVLVPTELEQNNGESDIDYIKRLKSFLEKQCYEMQDLLGRNATLAEDLAKVKGGVASNFDQKPNSGRERVQSETLRRDLHEAMQRIEILRSENAKSEAEASNYHSLANKIESDLKSLSDAYNSLEQANFHLESEVKALRKGDDRPYQDLEALKAEAREEAQKESEAELNDLLICLGQEQSKVEKLSARLAELGEDVDSLLQGIGDDTGLPEEGEQEEEDGH